MASEEAIRALLVEQLGVTAELIDHVQVIDVALALSEALGVAIPRYRLRLLRHYHDVLRAIRDALSEQLESAGADCYVRARLRSGRGTVVRVGLLTPSFTSALADDLRHAPAGAALEVTVPDDFDDAAVTALQRRLSWMVGAASLSVRRAGDVRPDARVSWDQMSQSPARGCSSGLLVGRFGAGIGVAHGRRQQQPQQRRRFPV